MSPAENKPKPTAKDYNEIDAIHEYDKAKETSIAPTSNTTNPALTPAPKPKRPRPRM